MTPLLIRCRLHAGAELQSWRSRVALDSLLASSVARLEGMAPARTPAEVVPIEIPVEQEADGRFHLCSHLIGSPEITTVRYQHRRFPVREAIHRSAMTRVHTGAGPQKHFRIPKEVYRVEGDELLAFALGERLAVRDLLAIVTHVGARRSAGLGKVDSWEVGECAVWDGFPVLDPDGRPLRPLPPGFPGIAEGAGHPEIGRLTYPYWSPIGTEEIVAP